MKYSQILMAIFAMAVFVSSALGAPGKWIVAESVDEIYGTKIVSIYTKASKSFYPDWKGDISLNFREKNGQFEAWISYPGTYLHNERIDVVYRIDDAPPMQLTCGVSTDYQAAWINNGWGFAKQLAGRKTLVVRVQPYSESPITCTFDLDGMAKAFQPHAFHKRHQ